MDKRNTFQEYRQRISDKKAATSCKKKKKRQVPAPSKLQVQLMKSQHNAKFKYEIQLERVFVEFNFDELTLENVYQNVKGTMASLQGAV